MLLHSSVARPVETKRPADHANLNRISIDRLSALAIAAITDSFSAAPAPARPQAIASSAPAAANSNGAAASDAA
jgi:hypothetical protein